MSNIDQIIRELISLDPSFAQHEDKLRSLILDFLAAKPDVVVDQNFILKLKQKLMIEQNQPAPKRQSWFPKLVFSGAALVVVLLAGLVGYKYLNQKNKLPLSLGSDVRITKTNDKAFGSLAQLATSSNNQTESTTADTRLANPASGFGGGGGIAGPDVYVPTNYKYVYKGDPISLPDAKLDVLKKINPSLGQLGSYLSAFGLGLVNLDSFPNTNVQSINFAQDKGYNIYVDLVGGNISINGYYDIMPLAADTNVGGVASSDAMICPVNGCPQKPPIDPKDVPTDDQLISMANDFINAHGISIQGLGQPEVMKDLAQIYNKYPIAETQSVVYPYKVGDQDVFDESGNKTGLMVSIDIRNKKVVSVGNLALQNYESSSYDAETDTDKILKLAEAGGLYNYTDPNAKKTVDIELGTPKLQYVQMWDYKDNQSTQLLVPSLIFPVAKQPVDGSFYRQAVVIPLITDILNNRLNGSPINILEKSVPPGTPTN